MTVLSVALICVTVVVLTHRYAWPLLDRLVTIRERAAAARAIEDDPIPVGLLHLVEQESEVWAVEDAKHRLRELHSEYRDWDRVRMAYLSEREG